MPAILPSPALQATALLTLHHPLILGICKRVHKNEEPHLEIAQRPGVTRAAVTRRIARFQARFQVQMAGEKAPSRRLVRSKEPVTGPERRMAA